MQSLFSLPGDLTIRNSGFSSHRFGAQTHRPHAAINNTRESLPWRHHQSAPLLWSKENIQSNHDNFMLPNPPVVNLETTEKETQESLHIWCLRFTQIPLQLWIQPFDRFCIPVLHTPLGRSRWLCLPNFKFLKELIAHVNGNALKGLQDIYFKAADFLDVGQGEKTEEANRLNHYMNVLALMISSR